MQGVRWAQQQFGEEGIQNNLNTTLMSTHVWSVFYFFNGHWDTLSGVCGIVSLSSSHRSLEFKVPVTRERLDVVQGCEVYSLLYVNPVYWISGFHIFI